MKNRTSACNSLGEKLNVGIRNLRYGRTRYDRGPAAASIASPWFAAPAFDLRAKLFQLACAAAAGGFGEDG